MESVLALFSMFLKDAIIQHNFFEKLEPFVNIKEEDGIYCYRIVILLKTLLVLYTVDSMFQDKDTWFFFAITNALTAMKYPPATVLIAAIQCLILPASSKKFALFSSTALFYILSIHIKFGEFLLDLYVVLSLVMCSFQISNLEHQKLRTVLSVKILIVCYIYYVHTYNLKQLSLIFCFLFLNHINVRPIISNNFWRRFLYVYAWVVIWTMFKVKTADSHEAQTVNGNLEFNKKWGSYEFNIISDNLERTKLLETVRNPKMLNVSVAKLTPISLYANLTCYSKVRENTCKAADERNEKTQIADKFSSLRIYDDNLTGKVQKKNIHFMKLELHKWESVSPKNRNLNLISDVEVLEENVNSNNIRKYFQENVSINNISPVNHSDKKFNSLNNNCVKANKKDSDDKRSVKNYIGLQGNMSEKFKQYNEKKLSNSKCIKYVAIKNEQNFSQEFKSSIDEKSDLIPNARVAIRIEDQLRDILRQVRKVIEISSDEMQKTTKGKNMQKVASIESQLIKSVQITDNITFYEQCLHDFGKLLNAEKIKQIEHMLMTILMRNEELKANLGSDHKIKEEKHSKESANGNLQDKKLSSEKDTGRTDDKKSKELDFKEEEENNKLKYLKSKKDETKYRNDQKISFIMNDDISLRNSLDSIQKKETEIETSIKNISIAKKIGEILVTSEEKIEDKPIRESKKLLIFNDNKNKNCLRKEQKRTKYKESRTIRKQKKPLMLDRKITLQNILDSFQEEKTKYETNSKSVSSSTKTGEILIINDKERNSNKSTRESKKTVIFSSRKNKEMLKKEKNAIEYETSLIIKPFRASKYSKNRLDTKDEIKLYRNILNGETKILGTLKEIKTSKWNIQDSPHVLEFKTLPCIRRENKAQSGLNKQKLSKLNRSKKYLKKESSQISDIKNILN